LISLNTWGGVAGREGLLDFFRARDDVDVFCLQEIWNGGEHIRGTTLAGVRYDKFLSDLYPAIGTMLENHLGYFRPHYHDWYGLAMFIKKNIVLREEGETWVWKTRADIYDDEVANHAHNIQYATFETKKGTRTIINFHGLWNGQGKFDTEERLTQSKNIVEFLKTIAHPYILCGDFNLLPDTESLKMFEAAGMRNLVKEFGVTSTRSSFYKKPHRFADYTLASDGVTVHDFKILPDEISDHLAMYLEFE